MTALLYQLAHAARCLVGEHTWIADVPIDAAGTRSHTLHQRCLYCRAQSPGLTQDSPHYAYRAGLERYDPRLTLHNPRLTRCACVACARRRQEGPQKVTAIWMAR